MTRILPLTVWAVLMATVVAQPKRERLAFAKIMERRHQLAQLCRGGDGELLVAVAERLTETRSGNPFLPLARALARLRGVDADPMFVMRYSVVCFATPEVPDGARFEHVNLTMNAPYGVPDLKDVTFKLCLRDAAGVACWRGEITEKTSLEDLRRYAATTEVPLASLEDGDYTVEVATWIGGEPPRENDPVTTAAFTLLRGFPDRTQRLQRGLAALKSVPPAGLLALKGAIAEVRRMFIGEPRSGFVSPALDLANAEAMLDNLQQQRPVLAGLSGWVTIALAVPDDQAARVSLRLLPKSEQARPLVLLMPGVPAWDPTWARPTSPRVTEPGWLRDALRSAQFDAAGRYQLAVVESPGRCGNAGDMLRRVVVGLRELLLLDDRVVLVGEREAGLAVTGAIAKQPDLADGVVLVAGGALYGDPKPLRDLAWLMVPGHGHPGNENLVRLARRLDDVGASVRVLPGALRPWAIATETALPEIGAFLRRLWP